MKLNIVLVEPEIPQNTGNIARTCAALGAKLHLVYPLGFSISEKQVKRAGLDYWDKLEIEEHISFSSFLEKYNPEKTAAPRRHTPQRSHTWPHSRFPPCHAYPAKTPA